MPTTSQWKILHALLKAGRLKPNDATLEPSLEKLEQDKENSDIQNEPPQRRNSFHFSKNERGMLTIICRPKSVPVTFASKQENNDTSDELNGILPEDQRTVDSRTNGTSHETDFQNNQIPTCFGIQKNVSELHPNPNSDLRGIYECDSFTNNTNSVTCENPTFPGVPNDYEDLPSRDWDGVSVFPELLDPNAMRKTDEESNGLQTFTSKTVLNRWRDQNANNSQSKTGKNVTFSHPFGGTSQKHRETKDYDKICDDEDGTNIALDKVTNVLTKFGKPHCVFGTNKKNNFLSNVPSSESSPTPSTRLLRPLKSAPSFRRVAKSILVFNDIGTQQRTKCNSGCITESSRFAIDRGISDTPNNTLWNSSTYPGGFKIRHTTFAYKEIPWVKERPRSSPLLQQKVTPTESDRNINNNNVSNPKANPAVDSEGFEPFVIHNGRLVRRGCISNGLFTVSSKSCNPGLIRKGSEKFSILGKEEATTLSRICDAFIIRGGSGTSRREGKADHNQQRSIAANGSQRPLSGPGSTRAVSRWSMATQSIITRSISSGSLTGISSQSATTCNSGFQESSVIVADTEEIELPKEVQEDLHKLGFRKQKGKKKKSEKSKKAAQKKPEVSEETLKSTIDLKQDPMLVKVQKKNKNVGTFACEPLPQPFAICFEIKGSAPSHADVLAEMRKLQKNHPEVLITKMQFDYRALVNNSPEMENRWIITTNSVTSRNRMAGSHIRIHGQEAQLRRYDDVITTEYQQYKRMMDFVKMMNSRLGMK